jgi:hypothetical protein
MHVLEPGRLRRLSVWQICHSFDTGEAASDKRILLNVANPGHMELLGSTLIEKALRQAETDDDVSAALRLLRDSDPQWPDVYDVIEFLQRTVADLTDQINGWINKAELGRHRGTANHYRHLGNVGKNNRLPTTPTTLTESREVIFGLLRRWLEERLR